MSYDEPRTNGVAREKGPDLIVSLRESLIEDSRIANVISSTKDKVAEPFPKRELRVPFGGDASEPIAELRAYDSRKARSDLKEIAEIAPSLSPTEFSDEDSQLTSTHEAIMVRVVRSLSPGFLSLTAIVALVVVLDFGQYERGPLADAWLSARDWFSVRDEAKATIPGAMKAVVPAVVSDTAPEQDMKVLFEKLTNKLDAEDKDLAASKAVLDEVIYKQDEIFLDLKNLQSAQALLSQKIASIHSLPRNVSEDQLMSQRDEMARDIAALQATQSMLSQKISTLQSRGRARSKLTRPD